ncbi:MAG: hypothetical protein ABEJ35_02125 [Halobacteriaceae archaeon]
MFDRLGVLGVFGTILVLVGVGTVALENLIIGAGLALILAGVGFVATGVIRSTLASFGMA